MHGAYSLASAGRLHQSEVTLSVQLESETPSQPACNFSFEDLAETLLALETVPSLAELGTLIQSTAISSSQLQPYLGFKAGNYCRHRVMRNEFVEMLVLC